MNLSLKKRLTIFTLSIALTAVLIAFLILLPAVKNILELRIYVTNMQQDLNDRYEKTQKLKRSLLELNKIKIEIGEISKSLVDTGDELKIITEMETIAQNNKIDQNIDLNFIKESATKNQKTINNEEGSTPTAQIDTKNKRALPNYYQISLLNTGSFVDHLNYIQALEKLPYYIIIDSISFEKRQTNIPNQTTPLTLRFDAIIYANSK